MQIPSVRILRSACLTLQFVVGVWAGVVLGWMLFVAWIFRPLVGLFSTPDLAFIYDRGALPVYLAVCVVSCLSRIPAKVLLIGGVLLHIAVIPAIVTYAREAGGEWWVFGYPVMWWTMCALRVALANNSIQRPGLA
jgi:hypothetical protein